MRVLAAERVQKILSAAGVASRRDAEQIILAGRVAVNGEPVVTLGTKADAHIDEITVDGAPIEVPRAKTYLLLYKPKGYVSTLKDPQGRRTVRDLLPKGTPRLFHVGRLDFQTEGLLLLTNDGEFADRVMHPKHGCRKVYLAKVSGVPSPESLRTLRRGVALDGKRTAPARVELVRSTRKTGNAWLALTLFEGRSREIRRMLQAVGHPVSKLKRIRIGPLDDRGLRPGAYRLLSPEELEAFRPAGSPGPPPRRRGAGARRARRPTRR